jgi:WD40 repeat protein
MKRPFKIVDCQESESIDTIIFDTAWSPALSSLLATSSILGTVSLYDLNKKSPEPVFSLQNHQSSCRSIDFTFDGTGLLASFLQNTNIVFIIGIYSVSKDKSLQMIHVEV